MTEDGYRVDSTAYTQAARALRQAGDKKLRASWAAAIRAASKPAGAAVLESAGRELPQRGGLGRRVAASKITVQAAAMRAAVSLRSPNDLAAIDSGVLRHPVFARKGKHAAWIAQAVRPGAFRRPFDEQAPAVRQQILAATGDVMQELANRGTV